MATTNQDRTEEFLRLLGEHDRMIYSFILAMTHHWADADDVMQETRLRLWQQFDKYVPGTDFGAWARSVAYYLVLAHREKASRSRLQFGAAFCDAIASEFSTEPNVLFSRQEALLLCMEKLDKAKRDLIENYCVAEQSLHDLAQATGRSYDSVRKSVYRTQLALADCIDREMKQKEQRP
jgi:RNA polymerase sigma-70 factor, ECF subfamily